jgi:hypothetical protein
MDVFARTFPLAAADAGLTGPAIARHLPLHRRCLDGADPVLLVSHCLRPEQPWTGEHLLALTRTRLSVSHASRALRRVRVHLDVAVADLGDVRWSVHTRPGLADFTFTTAGGVRERLQLRGVHPALLETTLNFVFRCAPENSPALVRRLAPPAGPVPIPNIARVPR